MSAAISAVFVAAAYLSGPVPVIVRGGAGAAVWPRLSVPLLPGVLHDLGPERRRPGQSVSLLPGVLPDLVPERRRSGQCLVLYRGCEQESWQYRSKCGSWKHTEDAQCFADIQIDVVLILSGIW